MVPRLILQFDERVLKEYHVGLLTTIGRLPDNDVIIENPAVSGHHACVFRNGDEYVVEDFQSTNGTFVNDKRVTRHALQNGDVLLVGKHKLVFDQIARAQPEESDDVKPMIPDVEGTVFLDTMQHRALLAKLDLQGQTTKGLLPTSDMAIAPPKVAVLRVLDGAADQSEYPLSAHTSLIGRAEASLIQLRGWFKPDVAVAIARNGAGYVATPIRGNTLINGQPQSGRCKLNDGDVLKVCGMTLLFRLSE